ncbi:MAG: hypothetical protein AAGI53_15305 [Planctomycetota bacterium]
MLNRTLAVSALLTGAVLVPPSIAVGQTTNAREESEARMEAARLRSAEMMMAAEIERASREIRVYDLSALAESAGAPLSVRFAQLHSVVEMDFSPVTETTYAVRAVAGEHDRLQTLLESIETERVRVFDEEAATFAIRFFLYSADQSLNPIVGQPFTVSDDDDVELLTTPQVTLSEETPAMVQVATSETYIAGYQPVVSDSAVGYQPNVERIESGIILQAAIEMADDDRASVELRAEISEAEIVEQTLKLGDATLPIGLPKTDGREMEGRVTLPFSDTPVVISVVQGLYTESDLLILAAWIQPVGPAPARTPRPVAR